MEIRNFSVVDFIVIDIETKNTFFDVGRDNFEALEVSFVGAYSYARGEYLSFFENQMEELGCFLKESSLIIGFSSNRFDIPVLNKHFNFNLFDCERFDFLDDIEMQLGRRCSLNILAKYNLGLQKTHHSLEAPIMYREGRLEELKDYCLQDVKITKELYDLARSQGYLLVPRRDNSEAEKVFFGTELWG